LTDAFTMNKTYNFLTLLFLFSAACWAQAQEDLLTQLEREAPKSDRVVFASFKTTRIVNGHSIETVGKNSLDFRITHHFGDVSGQGGGVHTLFGFDQASDIRLAFEYGITDRLTAGIGRSKIGEMVDGYLKYRLISQTTDNKIPVSVTLFTNAAITAQKQIAEEYEVFAHRLSYTYQALIARKFSSKFSFQLAPTFIHRNYIFNPSDENDLFSIGVGGRIRLTKSFALLADYFYTFSVFRKNNNQTYFLPLGLGVEIETGGHVFHIFFTNNAAILENSFIANTTSSWTKGEFKFGFNISRTFGVGRPR
jgi:hypothetical protein